MRTLLGPDAELVFDEILHLALHIDAQRLQRDLALLVRRLALQPFEHVMEEDAVFEFLALVGGLPLGATEQRRHAAGRKREFWVALQPRRELGTPWLGVLPAGIDKQH